MIATAVAWRARVATSWSVVLTPLRVIWRTRDELLLTLAILGGWALLTWGVVLFTTPKVWPLSGGLLLLSCAGWRMLWTVASYGLYGLTREVKRDG